MKKALLFVLLLLTTTAFIGLIVDPGGNISTAAAGDQRAQLMWGVIDCTVIIVCFFHGRQLMRVASRQPWILAFVGWATLSLAWSDNPQLTFRRVVGLICTTAMGFFLGMRLSMEALLRLLEWVLAFIIVTSFVAAVFFPSFGAVCRVDIAGWCGVFNHKNELGSKMAIASIIFTCLLWEYPQNRLKYLILLFSGVVLLALSQSMTSIIITVVTLSVGLYLRSRLRTAQKVAVYAIALLVGLTATVFLEGRMDAVFASVGRDSGLTGRVPLWRYSFQAVIERPFLGSGWDAFWTSDGGDRIRNLVRWPAPHAHNGFLELSLNIGLIGMFIFLIGNFECFRRAVRYSNDTSQPCRLWPLLFYSYLFLYNFTEAIPADLHTLTFILYCALSVSVTEATRYEVIELEQEDEYVPSGIAPDSGMIQESV
jgi:exopolysaccharide production protein ExoQ